MGALRTYLLALLLVGAQALLHAVAAKLRTLLALLSARLQAVLWRLVARGRDPY